MVKASRNLSIDRVRTFLTLVVLLHHSVIPFTYFGHTDSKSTFAFDLIVLATDSFFMAMFFFLSGLFVWPGIARKKPTLYLRERSLRLGVPGAIGALVLIPIAYYSFAIRQTPYFSFCEFWWKTITVGPWPSGPIWFLWVLLGFDVLACGLYRISSKILEPVNRWSQQSPVRFWLVFAAITWTSYIPLKIYFSDNFWFELGPFSLQANRVLFYLSYFLMGAGVGCGNLSTGVFGSEGLLPKRRWSWAFATLIFYALMWGMVFIKYRILHQPPDLPIWYRFFYGTWFVMFSASILFAIFAFFFRSKSQWLDSMQTEAYGMFLVHYPITLWIQYFLYDMDLPALAKGTTTFVLTVLLSWGGTLWLRKIPGVNRVL